LSSPWNNRIAHVNTINEINVTEFGKTSAQNCVAALSKEPTMIVMGATHVATVNNNTATYMEINPPLKNKPDSLEYVYKCKENIKLSFTGTVVTKEYSQDIKNLAINDGFTMILFDNGTLVIHPLNTEYFSSDGGEMTFPEDMDEVGGAITCSLLTSYFLIYATTAGSIKYYNLEDLVKIHEFNHQCKITNLFHQQGNGIRLIFVDDEYRGYVYCPTLKQKIEIQGWNKSTIGAVWEISGNSSIFVTWADSIITTYFYSSYTMKGQTCNSIEITTTLPFGYRPLSLLNGQLICQVNVKLI
jgi:hypothetical protein